MIFLISCSAFKACPKDSQKEKPQQPPVEKKQSANWNITFERIGGIAGFRDRLEIQSTRKGEYFVGKESKTKFDLTDETMERLKWVIGREDLYKAVGEYKRGKVADDITYIIQITKGDQVWHFKWETQAPHPAILDEVRPVFDEILLDARKLVEGG